jgi:hypothetical protein
MIAEYGVIVGCDERLEWILPWWWSHYSVHSVYPVTFIDFGMSDEALGWCRKRGEVLSPDFHPIPACPEGLSLEMRAAWAHRYGEGVWQVRAAWLKKPFALLHSPYRIGAWLDLDCQVKGSLTPLFQVLDKGADLAIAKDRFQALSFSFPGETHYNSGVIVFRQGAKILQQWVDTTLHQHDQLPGDQEILSRAIFLHEPSIVELEPIYNWYRAWGINEKAVIHHFCGGLGKREILSQIFK